MPKNFVNKILGLAGYQIVRKKPAEPDPLDRVFSAWSRFGTAPELLFDIGANHGRWTRKALRYFPEVRVLMVEPQEQLRQHSRDLIASGMAEWRTAGVADKCGEMRLFLPPRDDSASFAISEGEALKHGYGSVMVPVLTIDALVAEQAVVPGIIKIDAEGFDMKALASASAALGVTDVIFVECAVVDPEAENVPEKLLPFMWERGYRLFDVTELNISPKSGVLWLAEFVFVRKESKLWRCLPGY